MVGNLLSTWKIRRPPFSSVIMHTQMHPLAISSSTDSTWSTKHIPVQPLDFTQIMHLASHSAREMSKYQSRTVECSVTVVGQGYDTGRNYDVVNYECFPTLGLLSRTHTHIHTQQKTKGVPPPNPHSD